MPRRIRIPGMNLNTGNKMKQVRIEQLNGPPAGRKERMLEEVDDESIQGSYGRPHHGIAKAHKACTNDKGHEDHTIAHIGEQTEEQIEERCVEAVDQQHVCTFFNAQSQYEQAGKDSKIERDEELPEV